jgi:hypothetical protein
MGIPPGMKVVGTVGRLDYQKAPEVVVRALAELDRPDVFAAWVGDGPLRADVERLARELGVDDRMRFLGNRSDVPALLPGFDVFALPSRYEGLPCAIAEAMMCGIPVIATAVNAVPEMVVAGRTGLLIPPESPRALATAVRHLVTHPEQAARRAANASARLGDTFTPRALGERVADAYELVLSGASSRTTRPAAPRVRRRTSAAETRPWVVRGADAPAAAPPDTDGRTPAASGVSDASGQPDHAGAGPRERSLVPFPATAGSSNGATRWSR